MNDTKINGFLTKETICHFRIKEIVFSDKYIRQSLFVIQAFKKNVGNLFIIFVRRKRFS